MPKALARLLLTRRGEVIDRGFAGVTRVLGAILPVGMGQNPF